VRHNLIVADDAGKGRTTGSRCFFFDASDFQRDETKEYMRKKHYVKRKSKKMHDFSFPTTMLCEISSLLNRARGKLDVGF
jgi:hypothetical protein